MYGGVLEVFCGVLGEENVWEGKVIPYNCLVRRETFLSLVLGLGLIEYNISPSTPGERVRYLSCQVIGL